MSLAIPLCVLAEEFGVPLWGFPRERWFVGLTP